jgi:hypothetical protein
MGSQPDAVNRAWALTVLKGLAQVAAVIFVAWTAWKTAREWTGLPTNVDAGLIALAFVPLLISNSLLALGWIRLAEHLVGMPLDRRSMAHVFQSSNLGRYTPGKVGLVTIRVAALVEKGVSARVVGMSMLIEIFSWAGACGAVSALMLLVFGANNQAARDGLPALVGLAPSVLLSGSLLALVAGSYLDRKYLPRWMLELLHLQGNGSLMPGVTPLIHTVYWLCWILHGTLLLSAFGQPIASAAAPSVAFVIAPVIGFMALVAPAGAGVREAVIIAFLSPVLGHSVALTASLVSRVLSVAADASSWVISWTRQRRAQSPPVS